MDERTAKALMRALYVVVGDVLADEFSQVRLTQRRVLNVLTSR